MKSLLRKLSKSNISTNKNELLAINKCRNVIRYYNEHNQYPKITDPNKEISILGSWLANQRTNKKKYINGNYNGRPWYHILDKIAIHNGLPNLFDPVVNTPPIGYYEESLRNFVIKFNRLPKPSDDKKLYRYTRLVASSEFIKSLGMKPFMNNEERRTLYINTIIDHIKEKGTYPNRYEHNKIVIWLCRQRKNKELGNGKFDPILDEMVTDSYPNMFNRNWKDDLTS